MLIPAIVAAILILYVVSIYNRLVRMRATVQEGWSSIDVQLKKRYDLIPNLIETVKSYATHEKETLDAIVKNRNRAIEANTVDGQQQAENDLQKSLVNLFALSEAYPDLKANTNFLQMQNDLTAIEGDIEKSRRYYNGTVRENNIMVETFPNSLVAAPFGFSKSPFFEIESPEMRNNIAVKF